MTFRTVLALGLGVSLGQAAAADYSLRVDAGEHDRRNTPVTFPLPALGQAEWQLTGPGGQPVAIQPDDRGMATFIVGRLAAFQTAVYKLTPAPKPSHADAVRLTKRHGKLEVTIGDRTVLHYQAEKSELPRADLEPIYRRGGYIHPVLTRWHGYHCRLPTQPQASPRHLVSVDENDVRGTKARLLEHG